MQLVLPDLDCLARGKYPEGSRDWQRKKMIFTIQAEAKKNGFAQLAKASAQEISRAFTFAYTQNTGQHLSALIEQGKQQAIEHQEHPNGQVVIGSAPYNGAGQCAGPFYSQEDDPMDASENVFAFPNAAERKATSYDRLEAGLADVANGERPSAHDRLWRGAAGGAHGHPDNKAFAEWVAPTSLTRVSRGIPAASALPLCRLPDRAGEQSAGCLCGMPEYPAE